MRIQLLWRRMIGLTCLFLLGLIMITLNSVPRDYRKYHPETSADQVIRIRTEPSMTLSKTSISNAVAYVGGKLRLLVAYSSNEISSKNIDKNDYNDDFDIVGDDIAYDDLDPDEDDIENPNKTFRIGDFDYEFNSTLNSTDASTKQFQSKKLFSSIKVGTSSKENWKLAVVRDVVYWSNELERRLPKGVTDAEVSAFVRATKKGTVSRVEPPTWNRCGRPKNQFVIFQDGSRACARYRSPHNYLVQGELMSFYLSRLLGISNVPPVTLSAVDAGRQWKDPTVAESLDKAGWESNATVALISWVEGLERDRMPKLILQALKENKTIHPMSEELSHLKANQLVELVQWSDLILFDYITGNYDRVASMQDAADREKKPSIMWETIHNLVKSRKTETIWLIDNESGLLDAYSLLYGPPNGGDPSTANPSANRFVQFHRAMLSTFCIFRRSTVHRISWLSHKTRPARVLLDYLLKHEPLFRRLPDVTKIPHFYNNFKRRLIEVRNHVERCQKSYGAGAKLSASTLTRRF